ncbi:MAG: hypothetical protein KAR20_08790, partial [Candidatus Heimdallarchaeota archaeon]|nr:hypothetical protein [Candidatus Heimdallarchaeota archaeon]
AAILAKKGARLIYIIFLLGVWTTAKLPLAMYELNFFGVRFTSVHIVSGLIVYLITSLIIEKFLLKDHGKEVYQKLTEKG